MEDTIAAVATPIGEGGIGIIRVSGEKAEEILTGIFVSPKTGKQSIVNKRLTYGHVRNPDSGELIDEVMAVLMKAPFTYTREDVAEIHCHGGIISLEKILSLVLSKGARAAEQGEFTKRAFLNGRIDLAQAEAVIDLIKAKTDVGFKTAVDQAEGRLSSSIKSIRDELANLLAEIAVNIDYPDEDIEEILYDNLIDSISQINDKIEKLLATADTGRLIAEGVRITIAGRPNVGKSSLMNRLLGVSRAIVTDIPGTTRDTIEEMMSLKGIPIYLTDTAGIHETEDPVEKIGVNRSKEAFNKADLILLMIDASEPLREEDYYIARHIGDRKAIILANKKDLGKKVTERQLKELIPKSVIIDTSITVEEGIDELEKTITSMFYGGLAVGEQRNIVTNARHKELLSRAGNALLDGKSMAVKGEALDFIEVDIRQAYMLLGEITGEAVAEDIIDQIFSRFCLGK